MPVSDVLGKLLTSANTLFAIVNHIRIDNERSNGFIKGVHFGVVNPGVNVLKTLHITNTGAAGDRILDISIQSRSIPKASTSSSPIPSPSSSEEHSSADTSETLQTLTVPAVDPIKVLYDTTYRRAMAVRPGIANLTTFEGEFWDDGEGGEAHVTARMEIVGPWSIQVQNVELVRQVNETFAHPFFID